MSHTIKITTALKSTPMLKRSLEDLGIQYTMTGKDLYFALPQALTAIKQNVSVPSYANMACFKWGTDFYNLAHDAYARSQAGLVLDAVSQRYAYSTVMDEINGDLSAKGFNVEENVTQANGTIKITVSRFV